MNKLSEEIRKAAAEQAMTGRYPEVEKMAEAILNWMADEVERDVKAQARRQARFNAIKAAELAKIKAGRYDRR